MYCNTVKEGFKMSPIDPKDPKDPKIQKDTMSEEEEDDPFAMDDGGDEDDPFAMDEGDEDDPFAMDEGDEDGGGDDDYDPFGGEDPYGDGDNMEEDEDEEEEWKPPIISWKYGYGVYDYDMMNNVVIEGVIRSLDVGTTRSEKIALLRSQQWKPENLANYWDNESMYRRKAGLIYDDVDIGHNWTDEALNRLFDDIKNFDPTQNVTYTVDVDYDKINELVIDTDSNLDFSHLLPKK